MKSNNIYAQLVENLGKSTFKLDVNEDSAYEDQVVHAISQLYTKKSREAYQILSAKFVYESLSNYEKSLFLEAKISDLMIHKKYGEEIITLSEKAFQLNPHGAISRLILSRTEFDRGEIQNGIDLLLEVLKDYPEAQWIYLDIVRLLVMKRKYNLARPYIGHIPIPIWRIIYLFTVKTMLPPYSFIIVFGYLYGVLLLPNALWLNILVLVPYGILTIYLLVKNEIPLKLLYIVWFSFLLLITGLRFLYT